MKTVLGALGYGAANLLHPRMLWLMVWPMLVAAGFWGIAALFLWVRTAMRIAEIIQAGLEMVHVQAPDAALIAAHAVLFLLFVPLVWLTALFILGMFGMGQMVDHVAAASFPDLERRRGGGLAGSIANGIATFLGMLALAIVTVPLWVLAPLWPLIPLVIFAWANQRLLRYVLSVRRIPQCRQGGTVDGAAVPLHQLAKRRSLPGADALHQLGVPSIRLRLHLVNRCRNPVICWVESCSPASHLKSSPV